MPFAVERLESKFAAAFGFCGAVSAGFGRAALRLALEAIHVRDGDVLLPDFICEQIPQAVRLAGGRAVFYRVRRDLSVDPADFQAALTPATRAAVVAHYFGRPQPFAAALADICRERSISLIEDCALALGVPGIGTQGDGAIFSFTKSDWCYGGGLLASRSIELLERAFSQRKKMFQRAPALAYRYGLLCRADFAANRPPHSGVAERAGRALEIASGFRGKNFFDAGRFDTLLLAFAARRASRILTALPGATARRKEILRQLHRSLSAAAGILFRPEDDPRDSGAFVLLKCESGNAYSWRERATREGVTLRLCWPAYQELEEGQSSNTLHWFAKHFLLMEIHPKLRSAEVEHCARCLRELAGGG